MSDKLYIRPSQIKKWMACEASALHAFWNPAEHDPAAHIASWIGTAVHENVLQDIEITEPDARQVRLGGIKFDRISPTSAAAAGQARRIADKVTGLLDSMSIMRIESEAMIGELQAPGWPSNVYLQGTLDLVGIYEGQICIFDLKTSRDFTPAWLQVAAYALASRYDGESAPQLGIIHAPRDGCGNGDGQPQIVFSQQPLEAMEAAFTAVDRIASLIADDIRPTVNPTRSNCSWCRNISCAMRAADFIPR